MYASLLSSDGLPVPAFTKGPCLTSKFESKESMSSLYSQEVHVDELGNKNFAPPAPPPPPPNLNILEEIYNLEIVLFFLLFLMLFQVNHKAISYHKCFPTKLNANSGNLHPTHPLNLSRCKLTAEKYSQNKLSIPLLPIEPSPNCNKQNKH